jgi:hypothetical protein
MARAYRNKGTRDGEMTRWSEELVGEALAERRRMRSWGWSWERCG